MHVWAQAPRGRHAVPLVRPRVGARGRWPANGAPRLWRGCRARPCVGAPCGRPAPYAASAAPQMSRDLAGAPALPSRRATPSGVGEIGLARIASRPPPSVRPGGVSAAATFWRLARTRARGGGTRVPRVGGKVGRAGGRPADRSVAQRWLRSSFRIASSALMISARSTRAFAKLNFKLKDFVVGR